MGMAGNLLRVTRTELAAYLENSSLLESRLYDDETEEGDPKLTDIDKAWDGIIFLLTGQNMENANNHPLTRVLFSGQVIDEEQDLGYGPGHYLTPEQVKELHAAIAGITAEDLAKRYDPKKMTEFEVYPSIWENEEELEYLSDYFKKVQEVYAEAAKNDEGIITFIN